MYGFERSHLLQMRGLKLDSDNSSVISLKVASFTDAWIETSVQTQPESMSKSHLLQMRGLKHYY